MLRTRVTTGLVLAVIVAFSVLGLETTPASLVFGLIWLIGADEWARLAGLGRPGRAVYAGVFVAVIVGVLLAGLPETAVSGVLALSGLAWLLAFGYVVKFPLPLSRAAIVAMGLIVLPAAWLALHTAHGDETRGPGLVLTGLVIVWSADIGAFFVGSTLGKTPLAPKVSPKKTWEGVAGGVTFAVLAGLIAAIALELPPVPLAATGAGMALVSVVGDLGVSLLKRHSGRKDTGMLLPGHGGIMDRFDGVTAALPLFVLGLQFAHVLD